MHVRFPLKVHERNSVFITDAVYGSTDDTKHDGVLGLADANFAGLGLGLAAQALIADNGQHAFRLSLYEPDFQANKVSFVGGIQGLEIHGRDNGCGAPACFATGRRPPLPPGRGRGELRRPQQILRALHLRVPLRVVGGAKHHRTGASVPGPLGVDGTLEHLLAQRQLSTAKPATTPFSPRTVRGFSSP